MNILVTGGNGYIGSHIIVELLENNFDNIIVVDDLSHSDVTIPNKIYQITQKYVTFYNMDIKSDQLKKVFENHVITHVIHLAGFKSVEESTKDPLKYYDCNVNGTIHLLKVMKEFNVKNLIFSSSATVYQPSLFLLNEQSPLAPSNPYGHTKLINELMLSDLCKTGDFNCTILRYFNPIGNHESGLLMELKSENVMPKLCNSLINNTPFYIYGQYNTRDYIHVVDLAKGHVAVMGQKGYHVYNLGSGKGTIVLELVTTMEHVLGKKINYEFRDARPGDVQTSICDPTKIKNELGWVAELSVEKMCIDTVTGLNLL